jgi:hypothetical protein
VANSTESLPNEAKFSCYWPAKRKGKREKEKEKGRKEREKKREKEEGGDYSSNLI